MPRFDTDSDGVRTDRDVIRPNQHLPEGSTAGGSARYGNSRAGIAFLQTSAGNRAVTTALGINRTGALTAQRLSAVHGQHAASGAVSLTASLTSPVTEGARVRYEAEFPPIPGSFEFEFTLADRNGGGVHRLIRSPSRVAVLRLPGAGMQYRITCRVRLGRASLGSVSLDQDTVARDPRVPQPWVSQDTAAFAELANDFRGYILDSATATGPQGITALFLAAVLRMEIQNTPALPLQSPSLAREREIAGVEDAFTRRDSGASVAPGELDRSIGVGQVKASTAAMVTGDTPWVEQDRNNRAVGRAETSRNYLGLTPGQQRGVFDLLRWPKSNIDTAARLLSQLKNRSHRYPTLSRAAFGGSQRAIEIIATEYNLGPSVTPESLAQPSYYGGEIRKFMDDPLMQTFFPNT